MEPIFFVAGGVERVADERGGTDAEEAGKGKIAGFEGPLEVGLADAQNNEGDEFQQQAGAVKDEVDGDEALEGKLEGERPGECRKGGR